VKLRPRPKPIECRKCGHLFRPYRPSAKRVARGQRTGKDGLPKQCPNCRQDWRRAYVNPTHNGLPHFPKGFVIGKRGGRKRMRWIATAPNQRRVRAKERLELAGEGTLAALLLGMK
jgi:hypothetical protein